MISHALNQQLVTCNLSHYPQKNNISICDYNLQKQQIAEFRDHSGLMESS